MPTYRYQGRNLDGSKTSGHVDAPTEELAAEALFNKGVIPTLISSDQGADFSIDWKSLFTPSVPLEVLVIFCRQLYSLTKAGVPLLRSMKGLIQNCANKQLKEALEAVSNELTNGRSLSSSMQMYPKVFSPLFVSMIHVGENTGRLDEALLQLSHYYEQEVETRKRIKTAMRYPSFVISFILVAMFVLNVKVIPQFTSMFSRFGVDLPLPTRILIGMSDFFVNYWPMMIGVLLGCLFAFRAWLSTAAGRQKWVQRTDLCNRWLVSNNQAQQVSPSVSAGACTTSLLSPTTDSSFVDAAANDITLTLTNNDSSHFLDFDSLGRAAQCLTANCTVTLNNLQSGESRQVCINSEGYIYAC